MPFSLSYLLFSLCLISSSPSVSVQVNLLVQEVQGVEERATGEQLKGSPPYQVPHALSFLGFHHSGLTDLSSQNLPSLLLPILLAPA